MRHLFIPILAALAMVACAGGSSRQVVATVNGEKIAAVQLEAMLPMNLDSLRADTVKKQVLDGIITRKLFAQEAKREGLEEDAEYQVELEQKALVNQRLYDTITAPGNRLTEADVQAAYKLLQTEAHLRIISVPDESLAERLSSELDRGAVFESLAMKYSKSPSAVSASLTLPKREPMKRLCAVQAAVPARKMRRMRWMSRWIRATVALASPSSAQGVAAP